MNEITTTPPMTDPIRPCPPDHIPDRTLDHTAPVPPFFQWRRTILDSTLAPTTRHVLLTLGCHLSDAQPSCYPSIERLAAETGLTRRAVIAHLKLAREARWIIVSKQSTGRRWARNHYRIAWPRQPQPGLQPSAGQGSEPDAPPSDERHAPSASQDVHHDHTSKPIEDIKAVNLSVTNAPAPLNRNSGHPHPSRHPPRTRRSPPACEPADTELAHWLFGLIRAMHPGHRVPDFAAWSDDIRLMRERDGRTRREIAGLFRWANADPFWRANILSPAKLRAQWDTLVIRRQQAQAEQPQASAPASAAEDRRCAHRDESGGDGGNQSGSDGDGEDHRCPRPGTLKLGHRGARATWYCIAHYWTHAEAAET